MGQISQKWDKSGTFSDQILVHFSSESQNVLKSDLKKVPNLSHFGANLTDFGAKSAMSDIIFVRPADRVDTISFQKDIVEAVPWETTDLNL